MDTNTTQTQTYDDQQDEFRMPHIDKVWGTELDNHITKVWG